MEYIYHCKKNGRDYVYSTDVVFVKPQDAYAWRRGVREYADNYHASLSLFNSKKERVFAGTDAEFADEVGKYCDEALSRFNIGDVPGERGPVDPKVAEARALTAEFVKLGITKMTPEIMEALTKAAAKAKKAA